jgi:CheY-like chemotaxis protein
MGRTVLILEDDADIRDALAAVVEDHGLDVVSAANGQEGLRVLARTGEPCLILLDWWMPVLSGREFLERLREDPATRTVPVVVMTASDIAPPPGITAFLRKPFSVSRLLEVLAAHCSRAVG